MNIEEIKKILPHRYPFLLIDRVLKINKKEKNIIAQKNVTVNENFFSGHFNENYIMPGVLLAESMAQTIAILSKKINNTLNNKILLLAKIDNFKIKKIVIPGDVLKIYGKIIKMRNKYCYSYAEIKVENKIACYANFLGFYQ